MLYLEDKKALNYELAELSNSGINYSFLRFSGNSKEIGDIDILTSNLGLSKKVLIKNGFIKVSASGFMKFIEKYDDWIHLDVNNEQLKDLGFDSKGIKKLISRRCDDNSLAYQDQLIILLLEVFFKNKLIKEKYDHLLYLIDVSLKDHLKKFYSEVRTVNEKDFKDFISKLITCKTNIEIKKFLEGYHKADKKRLRDYPTRALSKLSWIKKNWRPIVLVGPDGSGKSTLTAKLSQTKWLRNDVIYMGPSSEEYSAKIVYKVMNILFQQKKLNRPNSIKGVIIRLIWHFINYLDFWLRYSRILKNAFNGKISICDRYPFDMYFRSHSKLDKIVYSTFFIKPRLVFLCDGDPKKIYERKPEELTTSNIDQTLKLYKQHFQSNKQRVVLLNTTQKSVNESLQIILRTLVRMK